MTLCQPSAWNFQRALTIDHFMEAVVRVRLAQNCELRPILCNVDTPACTHQCPTLGIDAHGSVAGKASPFCSNSMEILSGERTKAM